MTGLEQTRKGPIICIDQLFVDQLFLRQVVYDLTSLKVASTTGFYIGLSYFDQEMFYIDFRTYCTFL